MYLDLISVRCEQVPANHKSETLERLVRSAFDLYSTGCMASSSELPRVQLVGSLHVRSLCMQTRAIL